MNIDLNDWQFVVDIENNVYKKEPVVTEETVIKTLGEISFKNNAIGGDMTGVAEMCNPTTTYSDGWKIEMHLACAHTSSRIQKLRSTIWSHPFSTWIVRKRNMNEVCPLHAQQWSSILEMVFSLSLMLQVPRLLSPRLHREHDHWYLPRDYQGKSRAGEIQDQTSQHYRWIESSDMKQVATGCNKICCDTAGYKISRYVQVFNQFTQDYCCLRVHEATGRGLKNVAKHNSVIW